MYRHQKFKVLFQVCNMQPIKFRRMTFDHKVQHRHSCFASGTLDLSGSSKGTDISCLWCLGLLSLRHNLEVKSSSMCDMWSLRVLRIVLTCYCYSEDLIFQLHMKTNQWSQVVTMGEADNDQVVKGSRQKIRLLFSQPD